MDKHTHASIASSEQRACYIGDAGCAESYIDECFLLMFSLQNLETKLNVFGLGELSLVLELPEYFVERLDIEFDDAALDAEFGLVFLKDFEE